MSVWLWQTLQWITLHQTRQINITAVTAKTLLLLLCNVYGSHSRSFRCLADLVCCTPTAHNRVNMLYFLTDFETYAGFYLQAIFGASGLSNVGCFGTFLVVDWPQSWAQVASQIELYRAYGLRSMRHHLWSWLLAYFSFRGILNNVDLVDQYS